MSNEAWPDKKMFQSLKRGTAGLYHIEDRGYGQFDYRPQYQLGSGQAVFVDDNDGSDGTTTPAPVKTLELRWESVPVMFEALALKVRAGETLMSDDIESLDILPNGPDSPARPYTPWLPRQGWQIRVFPENGPDPLPEWVGQLRNNAGGIGNTIIALSEAFQALPLTGHTVRLTFSGNGTTKLQAGTRFTTTSHPGVTLTAKDSAGQVIDTMLGITTMGRRASGTFGFLEAGNMPLVPAPTRVQGNNNLSAVGPVQGMEIVWPPNGTPYLHVFRQGSEGNGNGVEYHLPLTPGLPQ